MKNDINNINDVKNMVDTFYGKVGKDRLLKNIFENIIGNRWEVHLKKCTVLANDFIRRTHLFWKLFYSPCKYSYY